MCGIAGFLIRSPAEFSGSNRPEAILERMTKALHHRGPDDCGTEVFPPESNVSGSVGESKSGTVIGVGNTRLSILDLSAAGHQPMRSGHSGNRIVFNGEIYNFRSLREDIEARNRSVDWRSETDTETLLMAYEEWGEEFLRRLRGMFAFGLWDRDRKRFFLARDRLGIKPLYYYSNDDVFLFASEIRALLASQLVHRVLNPNGLADYLTYQSVSPPRTLIDGVKMLPPGYRMTVDTQGDTIEESYWDLWRQANVESPLPSEGEVRQRLRQLLEESVELHLVSDVPVGVFLSGGIDSSALVALMKKVGRTPRTFTVGFEENTFDETNYARTVADRFHTDHTEVMLRDEDLLDQLPKALASLDRPTGDGLNSYVISGAVREQGLKVALSGLGGDELFAGYPSFRRLSKWAWLLRTWGWLPTSLRSWASRLVGGWDPENVAVGKLSELMRGDGTVASSFPVTRQVFPPVRWGTLVSEAWRRGLEEWEDPYVKRLREVLGSTGRFGEPDLLRKISYAEARTYMHDVLLKDTDQMSMAHSLEVRVPLLDHELVEFVMRLPDRYKSPGATPKRLLVESLEPSLPEEIVRRPKQGFVLPLDRWMRGELRSFCASRLDADHLGGRPFIDADALDRWWSRFLEQDGNMGASHMWSLIALEDWLARHGIDIP